MGLSLKDRKFKKGDKVRLIRSHTYYTEGMTEGKIYTVSSTGASGGPGGYNIRTTKGCLRGADAARFEAVKPSNEERMEKRMAELTISKGD